MWSSETALAVERLAAASEHRSRGKPSLRARLSTHSQLPGGAPKHGNGGRRPPSAGENGPTSRPRLKQRRAALSHPRPMGVGGLFAYGERLLDAPRSGALCRTGGAVRKMKGPQYQYRRNRRRRLGVGPPGPF